MATPLRRATRNRALNLPHYLIVGDQASLTEIELGIATLPLCARGRVFVEAETSAQIVPLNVPPRMAVVWLIREGSIAMSEPGDRAARAAEAWASEMICDDSSNVQVWLLGHDAPMSRLREMLGRHEVADTAIMSGDSFRV